MVETWICNRLKTVRFSKLSHPLSPNSKRRIISLGEKKKQKTKKTQKKQLSLSGKKDYLHSSFLEIFAAQLYPWYNIYLLTRSQGTLLCFRDWFLFRASVMQPTHAAIWTNSEIKHHMLSHVALYFLSRHVVQLQPDTLQDFISV